MKTEEEGENDKVNSKPLKTWDSNVVDNTFEILVVSQFTLYGIMKGNKSDFHKALVNVEIYRCSID